MEKYQKRKERTQKVKHNKVISEKLEKESSRQIYVQKLLIGILKKMLDVSSINKIRIL